MNITVLSEIIEEKINKYRPSLYRDRNNIEKYCIYDRHFYIFLTLYIVTLPSPNLVVTVSQMGEFAPCPCLTL